MSKGEKYFWISILILMTGYIGLHFFALNNLPGQRLIEKNIIKKSQPVLYEFFLSHKTRENLQLAAPMLTKNMNDEIIGINKQIDSAFDQIFQDIKNKNLDQFLDFHYSVIGEYTELGAMAAGKIGKTIEERLLGLDFSKNIRVISENIDNQYIQAIKRHSLIIKEQAYQDIDMSLNDETISSLNNEVHKNISQQGGKLGILLSARLAPKIIVTISTKLAAKASGKIALKTGAKLSAKSANAFIGASAGSLCGPAIIICSPALAIGAWFATDALISMGDEILNREQFRNEIIVLLNQQNEVLKAEYKKLYTQSFEQFSNDMKQQISELETKEKVKIKDKIDRKNNQENM